MSDFIYHKFINNFFIYLKKNIKISNLGLVSMHFLENMENLIFKKIAHNDSKYLFGEF
jgi:hypothetical protein